MDAHPFTLSLPVVFPNTDGKRSADLYFKNPLTGEKIVPDINVGDAIFFAGGYIPHGRDEMIDDHKIDDTGMFRGEIETPSAEGTVTALTEIEGIQRVTGVAFADGDERAAGPNGWFDYESESKYRVLIANFKLISRS